MCEEELEKIDKKLIEAELNRYNISYVLKDYSTEEKIEIENYYKEQNKQIEKRIQEYRKDIEKIREKIYNIKKKITL